MNKNASIALAVVALLLVAGAGAFALLSGTSQESSELMADSMAPKGMMMQADEEKSDAMMAETSMMKKDDEAMAMDAMEGETAMMAQHDAQYIPFEAGMLEQNQDKRRLLYFYANWCPTCQPVDRDFQSKTSELPIDVVVYRVNYNDTDTDSAEDQLAETYGVTYQHTFVLIDSQGNEVEKWNGGSFRDVLKKLQ